MILVPSDVKCSFCAKIFCCSKCRERHEDKFHERELADRKEEERTVLNCFICNGQKMPLMEMSSEMKQHVFDFHLPLRCGKCSRIFGKVEDLVDVEKCCGKVKSPLESPIDKTESPETIMEKENMGESLSNTQIEEKGKEVQPLEKINMRWRRKSVEFGKVYMQLQEDEQEAGTLTRQTSTPVQISTRTFIEESHTQISSINYTGNSSSDSDGCSSPLPPPKPVVIPVTSPKRGVLNKSRPKLPVQATPLRQVMSKSIQRAIAEHGHYRQTPPFSLHQRKMSFNSTSSSSENTLSLIKQPTEGEAPLDLRLSPALRRISDVSEPNEAAVTFQPPPPMVSHFEFEQIEVIIRRGEIKSDSSAMSNYKSCFSATENSGSMPELQLTPKLSTHNFIKKTISFETPSYVEKTPAFLLPTAGAKKNETYDDDDVFYTPIASPGQARTSTDVIIPIEDSQVAEGSSKSHSNLWSLMSSVMRIASRASEDIGESIANSDKVWKFSFKKPEFVKKAADYFTKRSSEHDEQTFKRRRTHSNNENRTSSQSSPATKRQKIQARRPIGRMRSET